MNFLKMFFFEIYRRKRLIFISIVFAFVAWFVAIVITDRQSVIEIKDIPIITNLANTQTEQLGLDVVKINPATVSVKVKGPRHKIGLLKKEDILVTPISFRNVTSDGDYEIALKAELKQIIPDVKIDSTSSESAVFSVDLLTTRLVELTCDVPNLSADEGFMIDLPTCNPKNLCVSGPKKAVDSLKTIQLCVDTSQKNLSSSKTFEAHIKFISIDGKELDKSLFKYNESIKFSVTVPVYKVKQVPLTFKFKNAPSCFDVGLLKNFVNVEPSQINLGLSNELADSFNELFMGYIDMRELDFDTSFNFNVVAPAGCKNLSQVNSAKVSFNTNNWGSKKFLVDDVQIINNDKNFDVKVTSSVLDKVKVVGFNNFLTGLEKYDITAIVDLSEIKLKSGEQTVPVNIGILNVNGVWPVGSYKCCISVKTKKN